MSDTLGNREAVRCVYMDDDPTHRERFARWLASSWAKLGLHSELEVLPAATPEEALSQLRQSPQGHVVFVADILFGEGPAKKPLGLQAIHEAREEFGNLAIVALSVGNGGYEERARKSGADRFVSKLYVMDNPAENTLGLALLDALRTHGQEPVSASVESLHVDTDDLLLSVVIGDVGKANIVNFAARLLAREIVGITPHYVAAGLSGAAVLRLQCELGPVDSGAPPDGLNLLIKVARNGRALESEKNKDLIGFPEELFVKYMPIPVVESGGWYAIGSMYQQRTATLNDWLLMAETEPAAVPGMVGQLWGEEGLGHVHLRPGWWQDVRPNVALWSVMTTYRRARIRLALGELGDLARKYADVQTFDQKYVDAFMGPAKRIGGIDEEDVAKGCSNCWSHGDLHGRNVLVSTTSAKAKLIDPANVEVAHWVTDVARLLVDLIVSCWDRGTRSYEWDNMSAWREVCSGLVIGNSRLEPESSTENRTVAAACSALRSAASTLASKRGRKEWEVRLGLAVEFLRASYREQLPAPKRVLGLLAGHDALRATEAALESNKMRRVDTEVDT